MSSVESLLISYGLLAVFLSSMLEADVVPVLAGVAAHRGCFSPALGILAASGGALAGDCFWFFLGRQKAIQNSSMFRSLRPKAESLFRRVGIWQVPASHLVYGTRLATMTWLGARGSAFSTFALADGLSSLMLTTILLSLGFTLSANAQIVLVHLKRVEVGLLVAVVLIGLTFYVRRKTKRASTRRPDRMTTGDSNK
jgi:membrane protein DedA with SNARE-associated domain